MINLEKTPKRKANIERKDAVGLEVVPVKDIQKEENQVEIQKKNKFFTTNISFI